MTATFCYAIADVTGKTSLTFRVLSDYHLKSDKLYKDDICGTILIRIGELVNK